MKKLIGTIFLFIVISSTSASEITFLDNPEWITVLEKAKKENKMIFFDAYAVWCGPCKMMDSMTYKNQFVADYYNSNFINVKYDMEKGQGILLAQNFNVTSYPSLLFLSPEGKLVHKGVGFKEPISFIDLGKIAMSKTSKFLADKKNALNFSPKDFLEFANQAGDAKDEDLTKIYIQYLQKQPDILGNEYLIDLIMAEYATVANEKSLTYIVENKSKIAESGKYKLTEIDDQIVELCMSYALSETIQKDEDEIDFNAIRVILEKFVPEKAFFVLNYFKVQYLIGTNKVDEALPTLDLLITNTPEKVSFSQMCNTLMVAGPILASEGKIEEPLKKFDAINLTAADEKSAYMKGFVKAIIYIKIKDFEKFKVVAKEMVANKNTPEKIKEDFREALERMK